MPLIYSRCGEASDCALCASRVEKGHGVILSTESRSLICATCANAVVVLAGRYAGSAQRTPEAKTGPAGSSICRECGGLTQPSGVCDVCMECGSTSGCS